MGSGSLLASTSGRPPAIVLGQTIKGPSVLRDDPSTQSEDLRTNLWTDLDRGQKDDPLLDGRSDEVPLMEVRRSQSLLVERHGQAVALPADLHDVHSSPPV